MTGLELEFTEKTMIATYRNRGGMLLSATYSNGEAELTDAVFVLSSDVPFFPDVTSRFDKVSPGEVIDLADALVIEPDLDFIASLEVRTPAVVTLSLRDPEGNVLSSVTSRTEILPYNFWPGSAMPESIASFVTPNADQLVQIRAVASDVLTSWNMSPSLEGYQGDINRVNYIGAAVFAAIKRFSITYVNPPADFETVGQRVRLPSEVVEKREGTCIDLAVLYCSVLESIGLNTVMFITRGHAFAGYWLIDDHNNDILSDDSAMFTRAIRNGELRAVECTYFVNGSNWQYNDAVSAGLARLEDMENFCYAVDVAAARTSILPLPTRTLVEGRWVVDRAVAEEAAPAPIDVGKVYDDPEERKTTRVDRWKRELLDTGTRNSLISMKPGLKTIPLLVSDDENLVDSLTAGRDFTLYPKPQDWDGARVYADRPFETELYMGTYASAAGQELSRGWIRTPLSEKETETCVRSVYRASVKELEESGCNALFVAAGILRWYEGKVGQPRYAPLLLVPAQLKKKNAGYTLSFIDEEVVFNVTLAELLRQEYEINIPGIDPLPTDDTGFNVEQVLQTVRRAIAGREGWEVLKGAALGVFTFSQYAMWKDIGGNLEKLEENEVVRCLVEGTVMPGVQDIDVSADPYGLCLTVPADGSQIKAVRAAGMGMSFVMHGPPGTGKSQTITNIITDSLYLGKTVLFVAEKKAALEVVQNRLEKIGIGNHCLELHSNKTEKSKVLEQLRNSLASCKAVDGSKLPELMADIERQRSALDAYVTELHAPCSWGLSAYESISRYESFAGEKLPDVRVPEKYVMGLEPGTIGELSDRVSRAVKTYASVSDMDVPSMRAVGVDSTVLGLDDEISTAISKASAAEAALASATAQMTALGLPLDFSEGSAASVVGAVMGVPQNYAYDDDLPGTVNMLNAMFSAAEEISSALVGIEDVHSDASCFGLESAASRAETLARDLSARGYRPSSAAAMVSGAREAAQTRKRIENDVRGILSVWKDSVFSADAGIGISAAYASAASAGFFSKKKARQAFMDKVLKLLRNPNSTFESLSGTASIITSTANDLQRVAEAAARAASGVEGVKVTARQRSEDLSAVVRTLASAGLDASKMPLIRSKLEAAKAQTEAFSSAMGAFRDAAGALTERLSCSLDLADPAVFRTFRDDVAPFSGRFFDWAAWNICVKWFAEREMDQLVEMVRSGVSGWTAGAAAEKAMYKTMFGISRQKSEVLRLFSSDSFEADIERFRKLDAKYTAFNRNLLKYKLYERTPRDLDSSVSGTEAAVLYRAINSTRMRKSIRQLLSEIPNLLPDICPCLLMSPQSVAQYITHDFPKFDLVIFDESSQIVTAKAIGALGRAKCAVVAGDNKQLPPTSFFQKKIEGGDDDAIDVESFLDDCLGVRMPETYLEWHYRSRHESLIGFSNRMFYGNRMLTFPSPNDSATKVSFVRVAGVYERGRRCNEAEARAVADEVRRRAMDGSGLSVGVIAFSISQQTAIEDMIDDMEAADRAFSKALAAMPEPLFVKNLETVQGDERDVILFSIGYGPGKDGTVFQNFGPINRAGGGRRLNVAVSRARREMAVFSSMTHADIKVTPASSSGVRSMREFLRYAENGGRFGNEPGSDLRAGDSAILAEVSDALAAKGYECRFGVGTSEFRVDVAVVDPDDPDRYILGILSDGESYKASENTRDREYARADVLRGLGWEVVHVWSVEWYFRRDRVMQNLLSMLDRIIARRDSGETETPAKEEEEVDVSDFGTTDRPLRAGSAPGMNRKAVYLAFDGSGLPVPEDPFARPAVLYASRAIIKAESPVSEANLLKEYCRVSGIRRLTAQKREALLEILEKEFGPAKRGTFVTYWAKDADPSRYDMFRVSSDPSAMRDIDSIPMPELLSAIADAVDRFGSFEVEAAPRVIASQFGFSRSGDRIREVVNEAMVFALEDGLVVKENGRYRQP